MPDYTIPKVDVPAAPTKTQQGYALTRVYTAMVPQDRAPGRWFKVRVDIRRDAYDFQSHYRTEVLTDDGWKPLHSISYAEVEDEMPTYVVWDLRPEECRAAVEKVAERLVAESYKILRPF